MILLDLPPVVPAVRRRLRFKFLDAVSKRELSAGDALKVRAADYGAFRGGWRPSNLSRWTAGEKSLAMCLARWNSAELNDPRTVRWAHIRRFVTISN